MRPEDARILSATHSASYAVRGKPISPVAAPPAPVPTGLAVPTSARNIGAPPSTKYTERARGHCHRTRAAQVVIVRTVNRWKRSAGEQIREGVNEVVALLQEAEIRIPPGKLDPRRYSAAFPVTRNTHFEFAQAAIVLWAMALKPL